MKHILKSALAICLIAVSGISCKKDSKPGSSETKATRIEITLSKYYNEDGVISSRFWKNGDEVALCNTTGTNNIVSASPVTLDNDMSLFTFALTGADNGDCLIGHFPAKAAISYDKGAIKTTIATTQNGRISPVYIGKATYKAGASIIGMTMQTYYTVLYANVGKGDYSITKAVLKGNAGENIAGDISINPADMSVSASSNSVTVEYKSGLDCRNDAVRIPFVIAPVTFANGYTITLTTDSGEEITISQKEKAEGTMGGKIDSASGSAKSTQLLLCGDNMIYLIDEALARKNGYKSAILWDWDAKSEAATVGKGMIRLDDCKPVDNNTKILATSSQDYAVLVDIETKKLLWYSNQSDNAHSADLLPGNRVAVACSDGGNCIQLFNVNESNKVVFSTPLESAHGVVWNPATERLYAIGGTSLNIYKLTDWDTSAPKLTLQETINTSSSVKGLHDMTLIDDNTLLIAGNKAAFYNISQNSFNPIPHFNSSTSLKSVNYNPETGECWYTDATGSDRELTWSSNDIRYTDNIDKVGFTKNIWIGDLNMYKVRVYKW